MNFSGLNSFTQDEIYIFLIPVLEKKARKNMISFGKKNFRNQTCAVYLYWLRNTSREDTSPVGPSPTCIQLVLILQSTNNHLIDSKIWMLIFLISEIICAIHARTMKNFWVSTITASIKSIIAKQIHGKVLCCLALVNNASPHIKKIFQRSWMWVRITSTFFLWSVAGI